MDNNNLPQFDPATFRPFSQSSTPNPQAPTSVSSNLPQFDPATFRPLGGLGGTEPTKPVTSAGENVAQGVGTAAAQSLSNLGSIGSHIPGVSYVAGKVGDVLGLPKL